MPACSVVLAARKHIAEWVRLTAEKEAERVLHGATPTGGVQPHDKAVRKAAKELGVDAATVSRAVAAESLPEPVKAAADAAGLGTVARAAVAREPTPEAQTAKVRQLAQQRADRKLLHSAGDDLVKRSADDEFAEHMLDFHPREHLAAARAIFGIPAACESGILLRKTGLAARADRPQASQ